ncbi:hypothetical protein B0H34DRAFT_682593 [Crassisporium funariophilum]|nr:hypothetical protein B0H34DRAFT_682593 [Crassisporium funariophilum]
MDSFMNLAKQGYSAYSESQSDVSKTGGQEYNSPNHSGQYGGNQGPDINKDEAIQSAQKHGSGESSIFESALGFLSDNKDEHSKPLDEERVTQDHEQAYGQGEAGNLSANSMGSAAALQVLKQFTSGGKSSSGSGGSQTQLISMAMAEATKLFDSSGGAASGNKQDAVNGAAMTVMKLLVQSKFGGGGTTGGSNSGGLGGLLSLASKFAK